MASYDVVPSELPPHGSHVGSADATVIYVSSSAQMIMITLLK